MGDEWSSLSVDVYKKADEKQTDDHVGAAITYEWQRHAFVRKKRSGHANIHASLKSDHDHCSDTKQAADIVFGIRSDQGSAEANE
jgi:hypothetical protein